VETRIQLFSAVYTSEAFKVVCVTVTRMIPWTWDQGLRFQGTYTVGQGP